MNYELKGIKLKATTLQETMVAMTISLITFSIGLMIFINIMRTEKSMEKLRASLLLKELILETKLNKTFINDEYEKGTFTIVKTISEIPENENLIKLTIEIHKNQKPIVNSQELIPLYKPNIKHDF